MVKKTSTQTSLSEFINCKPENGIKLYHQKHYLEKNKVENVYPFVKWAGGKRQLIPKIKPYIPKKFNNYLEPFVGGGAMLFYLLPDRAVIIDNNMELINCYEVIKKNAEELIESLKNYKYNKDYYYEIRALDQKLDVYNSLSNVEKAARTIFLNKTGYNGLYRVNSKGRFNVPFGRHKNPKICDKKNLKAVQKAIQNVEILHGSFEICLNYAKEDDFVYFDPPYYPLSDTALFTSYTKENFGKESQIQLYEVFKELDARGCKLLLSNSYCNFILDLYNEFKIITIRAKRAINSDSSKRGFINEVLIMN